MAAVWVIHKELFLRWALGIQYRYGIGIVLVGKWRVHLGQANEVITA